jgi:TPR repeat protein
VKVPKASSRQSSGEKLAKQVVRSAATRVTTVAVRTGVRAGKDFAKGASQTIAEYGGGAAVAKAIAPRLLGVAAAGVAAYLATTAIINRIKAAKDKKAAERAAVADAYRRSRLDAAAMLGRPLNAAEQKTLAAYFKQQAAQLGWRF